MRMASTQITAWMARTKAAKAAMGCQLPAARLIPAMSTVSGRKTSGMRVASRV